MNRILVDLGGKMRLREIFGVSYPTVRDALNGKTRTALAQRIRRTAIRELGGVEMKPSANE